MKGIYIITNPAYGDDIVKIGYGDDVDSRIDELNRGTGVLYPFTKRAVLETDDRLTDLLVHQIIECICPTIRKFKNKEFFELNYNNAISIFTNMSKLFHAEDKFHIYAETDEDHKNEEEVSKRSNFRFDMINLHPGDIITYKNDPTITAEVANNKLVRYNNELYSVTGLYNMLSGTSIKPGRPGTTQFTYNGKTLWELRCQYEEEES